VTELQVFAVVCALLGGFALGILTFVVLLIAGDPQ
jgi:hypothetical protein